MFVFSATKNSLFAVAVMIAIFALPHLNAQESKELTPEEEYEAGLAVFAKALEMEEEQKGMVVEEDPEEKDPDKEVEPLPKPDFAGAFAHFKKAGEAGHAKAALKVSELLIAGRGVPKGTIGAFEWAVKAAEIGDPEAQFLAASKFEEGRGTTKSLSKALVWYEKALSQGYTQARMKVAGLVDRGDPGVQQNRTRALPLYQEAAKEGELEAMYMIGLYLQRGYVIGKDEEAASKWYVFAAEQGEPKSQSKLGIRFLRGTGIRQDGVAALKWSELALRNPNGDVATKNFARECIDRIKEDLTPRKQSQAIRDAGKFEAKEFSKASLPPFPYKGPPPVYHKLTDDKGNSVEAAVLHVGKDSVNLELRNDGKKMKVPLSRLTEESRKLVEGLRKE